MSNLIVSPFDDPDGKFMAGDPVPVVSILGAEGARRWQWIADRQRVRAEQ